MNPTEFHKLMQDVLEVEGHLVGISKSVLKRVAQRDIRKADPGREGDNIIIEDVSMAHMREMTAFAKKNELDIPEWRQSNYVSDVYGEKRHDFDSSQVRVYEGKATARYNIVPLLRTQFEELASPYLLNSAEHVPEDKEIFAKWARLHLQHSIVGLSSGLDRVAEEAFTEMTAAIANGVDKADVIDIHRQKLYSWVDDNCLNVSQLRADSYIGEIYRCGVFFPSKVDSITDEDRNEGRRTYRERLHIGGKAVRLLADEFQTITTRAA